MFNIGYEWDAVEAWMSHRNEDLEIPTFMDLAPEYQDTLVMRAAIVDTNKNDGLHVLPDGGRLWLKDGEAHREDGPALISDQMVWWWLENIRMSFAVWCEKLNKTEKEKALLLLKYKV